MRSLVLAVLVGCGGSAAVAPEPTPSPKPPELSPELSPYLQRFNWLLGSWAAGDEQQSWIAVDGAIFGIALHPGGAFDLVTIDDGEGRSPADNVLRVRFMANGEPAKESKGPPPGDATLEFGGATYLHLGDGLSVTRAGATAMFKHVAPPAAPEAEAADKAFSADTAQRGAVGWAAAFAPDGAMLSGDKKIDQPKVGDEMKAFLAGGALTWAPIASGKRDGTAFTVGKAVYKPKDGEPEFHTVYITVWHQVDGVWKVFRDTGRVVNATP
jgi:hypothetical protein